MVVRTAYADSETVETRLEFQTDRPRSYISTAIVHTNNRDFDPASKNRANSIVNKSKRETGEIEPTNA